MPAMEFARSVKSFSQARTLEPVIRLLVVFGVGCFAAACSHDLQPDFGPPVVCRPAGPVVESVFLIGDAGAPELPDENSADPDALIDPVLSALSVQVQESVDRLGADRTAVLILGDNVYPAGLPPAGEEGHEEAARVLDAQITAIGDAQGMFTLGNHDWSQGDDLGWSRARAQADYLAQAGPNISLHPADGCAGPKELDFGDHIHLVFLDLWAAIYELEHPGGPQSHCYPAAGEGRILAAIDAVLDDVSSRRTVLVAHPPMLTSGPHGGYFPLLEHLFPFRVFNRDLWVPFPLLGSAFPISRMLGVTDTDQMSASYASYVKSLKLLFSPGHPTLVAAGHEHSLQIHIDPTGVFHAVSGAGSVEKVDYVRNMESDLMSLAAPGFMRLDAYGDGTLRLGVIAGDEDVPFDLVFSTCIP